MASTKILLGFILAVSCCCTVTRAEVPRDCCLEVRESTVDKTALANYHRQVAAQGCSINAVVLVSRRGLNICVPPESPRLPEIIRHVDHLRKYCKKHNYKPNRCFGVSE